MENEDLLRFEKNGLYANKKTGFLEETGKVKMLVFALIVLFLVGTLISGLIWGFPVAL